MALSTINPSSAYNKYTATANQKIFNYTFLAASESEIVVYLNSALKTLGQDYTITGIANVSGGTIVFNNNITINAGAQILIKRMTSIARTSYYSETGGITPSALNTDLVKIIQILQELARDILQIDTNGSINGGSTAGMLASANNLGDLQDVAIARTNLGVNSIAEIASFLTNYLLKSDNLSSLADKSVARTNLGVHSIAEITTLLATKLTASNNLSDVNAATARDNLSVYSKSSIDSMPYDTTFAKKIRKATFAVGDMTISAKSSDYFGWILCDGRLMSRSHELFGALGGTGQIGSFLGAGDGSTTFNIPNFGGHTMAVAGQVSGGPMRWLGQKIDATTENTTATQVKQPLTFFNIFVWAGEAGV